MTLPRLRSSFVVLHAGHGQELAVVEYVYRVLLSLIAFGGVAALVYWWRRVVSAVRSAFAAKHESEASDP